ncbi:MAG: helix-turn-helix domain-containing protein [Paracoccaceae bacterium]
MRYTFEMPRSADTHARILEAAYRGFYREGFMRVSMDDIAETAGVTKRTLYQHYDSKDALLAAALESQREQSLRLVLEWDAGVSGGPADLIRRVFDGMAAWAGRPGWLGSGFSRISLELADMPGHPARRVAREHKETVERWLAGEFRRLGAPSPTRLATETVLLMEGSMLLALLHGDLHYFVAARDAMIRLASCHDG